MMKYCFGLKTDPSHKFLYVIISMKMINARFLAAIFYFKTMAYFSVQEVNV